MGKWEIPADASVVGQLLALLAHDLRNPLSALHSNLGYLQGVAGRMVRPDAEVAESISDGLISCDGLSHIIDNVDFLAQRMKRAPRAGSFSAAAESLVREAAARCTALAKSHGVLLVVDVAPGSEACRITCNKEALSRALANLIRNSIQFSSVGARVTILLREEAGRVQIELHDTGSALPVSREDVFGLRAQLASKSGSDGRYSRWLGLFVAALAADEAGGALTVTEPAAPNTNALRLDLPAVSATEG